METNGQRHQILRIRLSIQIFNTGSARPRDRKLAKYESYDDVIWPIGFVIKFLVELRIVCLSQISTEVTMSDLLSDSEIRSDDWPKPEIVNFSTEPEN